MAAVNFSSSQAVPTVPTVPLMVMEPALPAMFQVVAGTEPAIEVVPRVVAVRLAAKSPLNGEAPVWPVVLRLLMAVAVTRFRRTLD